MRNRKIAKMKNDWKKCCRNEWTSKMRIDCDFPERLMFHIENDVNRNNCNAQALALDDGTIIIVR